MSSVKYTKVQLISFALLSLALSVVILLFTKDGTGIPPRSLLQVASGNIAWVKSEEYGVKFGLEGKKRSFVYASKGNEMELVFDSLSHAGAQKVTVLFDVNSASGPIYSNDVYFPVFELHVSEKAIRTYQQIQEGWSEDAQIGRWLILVFALIGIFLLFIAYKSTNGSSQPLKSDL